MLWPDIDFEDERQHPHFPGGDTFASNVIETDLQEHYKTLIDIRKKSPALTKGSFRTFAANDSSGIYGFYRQWEDARIYVLVNSRLVDAQTSDLPEGRYVDLVSGETIVAGEGNSLSLPAKSGLILERL